MEKVNFLLISTNNQAGQRAYAICKENQYTLSHIRNSELIAQFSDFILVTTDHYKSESDMLHDIRRIKQLCPEAFLVVSIPSKLSTALPQAIKKAGADCVFLDLDLYNSSKLEFASFQKIRASYVAIKTGDIKLGTSLDCFLYQRLPMNQNFLPILWPNETVSNFRMEKINKARDAYILRKDISTFQKYILFSEANSVNHGRIQFMHLMSSYYDLLLYFCDHAENSSFKKGEDLLKYCIFAANRLVDSLKDVSSIWPILDLAPIGNYGSVERSPVIATYAAFLGIQSRMGNPTNTLLAALLADLGMLFLSPSLAKKIEKGLELSTLTKLESDEYKKHPSMSIVAMLSRKIKIPEPVKQIILRTHERVDQTGFPYMPHPEIIPLESMLIQYSEIMLEEKLIPVNTPLLKPQPPLPEHLEHSNIFSVFFLVEVQKYLGLAN